MSQKDDRESPFDRLIVRWNNDFPIDYIWRKKYNIAFRSKEHLDISHLNMFLDLREEKLFKMAVRHKAEQQDREENEELGLALGTEKNVRLSKQEIDDEFDSLNLEDYE